MNSSFCPRLVARELGFHRPTWSWFFCFLFLLGGAALRVAGGELVLSPDSAVRAALSQNLELRAARGLVAEAEARASGAGRWSNPELSGEFTGGNELDGRTEIGVTQRFPLASRLRLARNLSALEVDLARLEVAVREAQLARDVEIAFIELAAAREAIVLAERQTALAREFAEAQVMLAKEGSGSSLDADRARLAVKELDTQPGLLRIEAHAAAVRLATLLGIPASTELRLSYRLEIPGEVSVATSSRKRADILLAERTIEAGDAGIALARSAKWEDIGVGIFYEGERSRDDLGRREHEHFAGVRVSVPLPLWQKGDAQIAERRAVRERVARQLEASMFAAANEAAGAFRTMQLHHESARTIAEELVPAAREHLAAIISARDRGEIDLQPVFQARERLGGFERAALDARKKFHLARIEWLAATGSILSTP